LGGVFAKNTSRETKNFPSRKKAKGAQIRSREKWVEFGEKNNAYFLDLEKKRQIKMSITKLLDDEK
jgi:hypothetical protein